MTCERYKFNYEIIKKQQNAPYYLSQTGEHALDSCQARRPKARYASRRLARDPHGTGDGGSYTRVTAPRCTKKLLFTHDSTLQKLRLRDADRAL